MPLPFCPIDASASVVLLLDVASSLDDARLDDGKPPWPSGEAGTEASRLPLPLPPMPMDACASGEPLGSGTGARLTSHEARARSRQLATRREARESSDCTNSTAMTASGGKSEAGGSSVGGSGSGSGRGSMDESSGEGSLPATAAEGGHSHGPASHASTTAARAALRLHAHAAARPQPPPRRAARCAAAAAARALSSPPGCAAAGRHVTLMHLCSAGELSATVVEPAGLRRSVERSGTDALPPPSRWSSRQSSCTSEEVGEMWRERGVRDDEGREERRRDDERREERGERRSTGARVRDGRVGVGWCGGYKHLQPQLVAARAEGGRDAPRQAALEQHVELERARPQHEVREVVRLGRLRAKVKERRHAREGARARGEDHRAPLAEHAVARVLYLVDGRGDRRRPSLEELGRARPQRVVAAEPVRLQREHQRPVVVAAAHVDLAHRPDGDRALVVAEQVAPVPVRLPLLAQVVVQALAREHEVALLPHVLAEGERAQQVVAQLEPAGQQDAKRREAGGRALVHPG